MDTQTVNYSKVLSNRIGALRRESGMTQDVLAEKLGVTFQAVSKWENSLSCPDIALLPPIADVFHVSIDSLFGRKPEEESNGACHVQNELTDEQENPVNALPAAGTLPWNDDDALHIAVFHGTELLTQVPDSAKKIVFELDGNALAVDSQLSVSCGDVSGNVTAQGNVDCGDVTGCAAAGGDVSCGDVSGSVQAGGNVDCSDVGGNVSAGADVNCGDIGRDVSAGHKVEGGDVGGEVGAFPGGTVNCGDVSGDVTAAASVCCSDVGGSAKAGGSVTCGDVERNVSAGGNVTCGDVGGNVSAGGSVIR